MSEPRLAPAAAAVVLLAAGPAAASAPYLVRDIDPTPPAPEASSLPDGFVDLGPLGLFTATDGANGYELWATDGTAAGTRLVRDFCPGPCSGGAGFRAVGGGRMFFTAGTNQDGITPSPLWATDGTTAGTVQLTSGLTIGSARWSESLQLLLFAAEPSRQVVELWATDGTAAGTRRLAGAEGVSLRPTYFADLPGQVLFQARDLAHGTELWRTDGTPEGTSLLLDIVPGADSSEPEALTSLGDRVVFSAWDPTAGEELWASDGTVRGTRRVRDIRPGAASSFPGFLTRSPGRAYFVALGDRGQELWVTDGTTGGTRQLTDLAPELPFADGFAIHFAWRGFGGSIVIAADNGVHGRELWVSDGTPAGTHLAADICPGPCSAGDFILILEIGGTLYFPANDGQHGEELWASDGTPAGTRQVADLCPGPCSSGALPIAEVDGALLFWTGGAEGSKLWRVAGASGAPELLASFKRPGFNVNTSLRILLPGLYVFDGFDPEHGVEPWVSDGTAAGTHLLRDIGMRDTTAVANTGSRPGELTALGGRILFTFSDGFSASGLDLWTSDGTAAGTRLVREIPSDDLFGTSSLGLVAWRDRAFFSLQPFSPGVGFTSELWASDGTPAGTRKLAQMGFLLADPLSEVALGLGRNLFMLLPDGLWKSDGTPEGTVRVSPVGRDLNSRTSGAMARFKGQIFYGGSGSTGVELWKSDGTLQGTTLVKDIRPGPFQSSNPSQLTPAGGLLFFTAATEEHGSELWRSDGTEAGTVLVADLEPGREGSNPGELTALGNRVFFTAWRRDVGNELWVSDGTAAGTFLVKDLAPGERYSFPAELTAFGGFLFFTADDGVHGRELWRSDGTPAGTFLVRDLAGGPAGSAPHGLTVAGSTLLFAAADAEHGLEPWQSDGTAEGTALVGDLAPGPASSDPHDFTVAGTLVFFVADDNRHGAELWALCPAARPALSLVNARVAEGRRGTVPMSFRVNLSGPFCAEVRVNYATQPGTATPGVDYTPAFGTLVFPPGTTSLAVPVPVLGDRLAEPDETLFLRLARPENATLARRRARGLIVDDDRR